MAKKVNVHFSIRVRAQMGGSFEMDEADAKKFMERWKNSSRRRLDEEALSEEFLDRCPFDPWGFLNVDEYEFEDLTILEETP